jgi:8-oxo-dGTP diphosphatase
MIKVACAIIIHEDKILITQHGSESDHPFKWEFPGGKVMAGESLTACIVREIWEELEIEIEVRKALIPVKFDYGIKQIELIPFICSFKKGKIKLNEHVAYNWTEIENLLSFDFSEADRELILIEENWTLLKKYTRENMHNSG